MNTADFLSITRQRPQRSGTLSQAELAIELHKWTHSQILYAILVHAKVHKSRQPERKMERKLLDLLFAWMMNGFQPTMMKATQVRQYQSLVLGWMNITPRGLKYSRHPAWRIVCAFSMVLGWQEITCRCRRCGTLRLLLRFLPGALQRAVLLDKRTSIWSAYCRALRATLSYDPEMAAFTCVYVAWGREQKSWYVGKANCHRQYARERYPFGGVVHRFQEHFLSSHAYFHDKFRYQLWRREQQVHLFYVPIWFGTEKNAWRSKRESNGSTVRRPSRDHGMSSSSYAAWQGHTHVSGRNGREKESWHSTSIAKVRSDYHCEHLCARERGQRSCACGRNTLASQLNGW